MVHLDGDGIKSESPGLPKRLTHLQEVRLAHQAAQVQLHHRLPLSTADQRDAPMPPSPHQHLNAPEADHQSRMVYPMTLQYLQEVTAHQRHSRALTAYQRRPLQHPQSVAFMHPDVDSLCLVILDTLGSLRPDSIYLLHII